MVQDGHLYIVTSSVGERFIYWGALTHATDWALTNRNLFPSMPGAWKLKIRVQAGWFLLSLLALSCR